jgi:5-methylcytosine-specific restriction endonuclease McrA
VRVEEGEVIMEPVVVLDKRMQFCSEVKKLSKIVKWLSNEKISVLVQKEDEMIRGIEVSYPMPLVVMLHTYPDREKGRVWKVTSEIIEYSPEEVYKRDNNQCQYWHIDDRGKKFVYQCTELDRTIDHVIPRFQGGGTSFENCVCCCQACNGFKGGRTPKEAGMELIRKPFVPKGRIGEEVTLKFVYNPNKLSHRYYMEQILNRSYSVVAK